MTSRAARIRRKAAAQDFEDGVAARRRWRDKHRPLMADVIDLVGSLGLAEDEGITWRDSAACAGVDPELHFPEKGGSTREAKRICASCPVKVECLTYALERSERWGVWGGLSERERRRLLRDQAA